MVGRFAAVLYGIACYILSFCSLLYAMAFFGGYPVPKSIDVGPAGSLVPSILIDVALIGLFAVQHSVMARPAFKQWWTRIVPASCERSTYVLASSLALILLFWQWRPIAITVWRVEGWAAIVLTALYWFGWLMSLASSYMLDHFEMFGLRQVFVPLRQAAACAPLFKMPLLYRVVRHPIMLGLLIAFWATPYMTAGHALFAISITAYVFVGIALEEHDLIAQFGATYERYRRRVPMLVPGLRGRTAEIADSSLPTHNS